MLFYFLLLIVISLDFILEHVYFKNKEKITNERLKKILDFIFKYRIITVISFVFMSTFKDDTVGCDTLEYIRWFNIENYRSDIFYSVLQLLVFRFGFSYRVLWFVIALFTSFCFVLFINYFSKNKVMSFILYVTLGIFSQSMSFMRQIISLDFLLLEMVAIDKKQWKNSCIFIACAILFHRSGFIGLLFLLLRFIKLNWKTIICISSLAIIMVFLLPYIASIMEKLGFPSYYQKYFVGNKAFIQNSSNKAILYTISLAFIFLFFYIYMRYIIKVNEKDEENDYYFLKIFLFVPLLKIIGLFLNANALFNRIQIYFFVVLILLIPNCLEKLKNKKKLYYFSMVLCYLISLVYMCCLGYINYYQAFQFTFCFIGG